MSHHYASIILWCLLSIQATGELIGSDIYSIEYEEYDDDSLIKSIEEEPSAELETPEFVSQRVDLVVNEEETIRLPCLLERLEGFTILWKKGGRIISLGNNILDNKPDSRFSLDKKENGNYLIIGLARISDEGSYECQVSSSTPKQIFHTVKIRVMPILSTIPEKSLTVMKGDDVSFNCSISKGNPKPRLFWRKKHKELMSDIASEGELLIKSIKSADAGVYQCVTVADNGFNETFKEIDLFVEYVPRVALEQTIFKSLIGEEIHITCVVEGFPKPKVIWTRNGVLIDDKSVKAVINNVNDRHNIILIDEKDEGLYKCKASNYVGESSKSLRVSGSKCDPKLKSIFKMDNKGDFGGDFEVKICTEEINKEDDILREFQSYSAMSKNKPLTYPKLEIRNFYLEKQNDVIKEGITERTTKNDSGLARFSYIAQMRNTIQKESVQGKIFIDMEKFNTIIKKYCDLLKEKKEIKKEDIMRIESQKKNESKLKHRMKKKSPDLAGLLKKVFFSNN